MAKLLTRGQILSAPVPTIDVETPDGLVRVRAMSPRLRVEMLDVIHANERAVEDYEADQALDEDKREGLAKVERYDQTVLTVLFTLVDEKGNRLFSMDDYDAACDLSMPSLRVIWEAFMQLESGVTPASLKKTS